MSFLEISLVFLWSKYPLSEKILSFSLWIPTNRPGQCTHFGLTNISNIAKTQLIHYLHCSIMIVMVIELEEVQCDLHLLQLVRTLKHLQGSILLFCSVFPSLLHHLDIAQIKIFCYWYFARVRKTFTPTFEVWKLVKLWS